MSSPGHTQVAPARRGRFLPSAGVNLSCEEPWTVGHTCSFGDNTTPPGSPCPRTRVLPWRNSSLPLSWPGSGAGGESSCARLLLLRVQSTSSQTHGRRTFLALLRKHYLFSSCFNERVPRRFVCFCYEIFRSLPGCGCYSSVFRLVS